MKKYKGGHKVGKGAYWNLSNGQKVDIETEGVLPGDENSTYTRVSSVLMLLLGPVLGLLYVIFLPLLAIATVISLAGGKVVGVLFGLAGRSVSFGWKPADSYLTGKNKKEEKQKKEQD